MALAAFSTLLTVHASILDRAYATSLEVATLELATSLTRERFQVTVSSRVESCLANRLEWLDR